MGDQDKNFHHDEKRGYRRIQNEFNVRIARESSNASYIDLSIDVGKSIDISANGLLLSVNESLGVDDVIRVTFLKPNTFEFFEGLARVIRIEEDNDGTYKAGINFFDLSETEMNRLNYYLTLVE